MKCCSAIRPFGTAALAAVLGFLVPGPSAETRAPERFVAHAVDIGSPGRASAGIIEIVVERYSSEGEGERLLEVLLDKGPGKLLDTLQGLPRVGYFRAPGNLAWDVKFARTVPGENGGEVISLITDRYISFGEAYARPRTIDYPFTLIELRMPAEGAGEGKMSIATKITGDKRRKTVILEDYKSQPVMLTKVTRESSGE